MEASNAIPQKIVASSAEPVAKAPSSIKQALKAGALKVAKVAGKFFAGLLAILVAGPLLLLGTLLSKGWVWNRAMQLSLIPAATYLKGPVPEQVHDYLHALRLSYGGKEIKVGGLDGMALGDLKPSRPTVVYFCRNMQRYEQAACSPFVEDYLEKGFNVVMFNYRGVGMSSGNPKSAQDLVDDAESIVSHVHDTFKIPYKKMLFHGDSLGGAIATVVGNKHPEAHLRNVRSFTRFSDASKGVIAKYGYMVGSLFRPIIAHTRWELDAVAAWNERLKKPNKGLSLFETAARDEMIAEQARIGHHIADDPTVSHVIHEELSHNMSMYEVDRKATDRWLAKIAAL